MAAATVDPSEHCVVLPGCSEPVILVSRSTSSSSSELTYAANAIAFPDLPRKRAGSSIPYVLLPTCQGSRTFSNSPRTSITSPAPVPQRPIIQIFTQSPNLPVQLLAISASNSPVHPSPGDSTQPLPAPSPPAQEDQNPTPPRHSKPSQKGKERVVEEDIDALFEGGNDDGAEVADVDGMCDNDGDSDEEGENNDNNKFRDKEEDEDKEEDAEGPSSSKPSQRKRKCTDSAIASAASPQDAGSAEAQLPKEHKYNSTIHDDADTLQFKFIYQYRCTKCQKGNLQCAVLKDKPGKKQGAEKKTQTACYWCRYKKQKCEFPGFPKGRPARIHNPGPTGASDDITVMEGDVRGPTPEPRRKKSKLSPPPILTVTRAKPPLRSQNLGRQSPHAGGLANPVSPPSFSFKSVSYSIPAASATSQAGVVKNKVAPTAKLDKKPAARRVCSSAYSCTPIPSNLPHPGSKAGVGKLTPTLDVVSTHMIVITPTYPVIPKFANLDSHSQLMESAPVTPNPPTIVLPSEIVPESHRAQIPQLRADLIAQQQATDALRVKLDDLTKCHNTLTVKRQQCKYELLELRHHPQSSYDWERFTNLFLCIQTGCGEIWNRVFGDLLVPRDSENYCCAFGPNPAFVEAPPPDSPPFRLSSLIASSPNHVPTSPIAAPSSPVAPTTSSKASTPPVAEGSPLSPLSPVFPPTSPIPIPSSPFILRSDSEATPPPTHLPPSPLIPITTPVATNSPSQGSPFTPLPCTPPRTKVLAAPRWQ
ncbi:hypothetical protein JAAARDRAFT_188471 [Jaapia argillacea MUCL 33604]|uniref:Zn(2)-C6 fungal-type domain-containing protein n=1 Tax=Jaapia argillacea MUCL 33604 TaxID=933084 RepID=A0A067QR78_9AGAM|nr:hypothetical protein JAAARDRAFT_188471 [Jaapia argillacea MUCL 33604]